MSTSMESLYPTDAYEVNHLAPQNILTILNISFSEKFKIDQSRMYFFHI